MGARRQSSRGKLSRSLEVYLILSIDVALGDTRTPLGQQSREDIRGGELGLGGAAQCVRDRMSRTYPARDGDASVTQTQGLTPTLRPHSYAR